MRNDEHKNVTGGDELVPRPSRGSNGILPNSFKTLSSYLRFVSSGASTVASTVRSAASAASAMVDKESESCHDLVSWAGFDKIELQRGTTRQILLLGFSYGFQVWDVEEADNVRNLVSRHDGPVSFLQLAPKPIASNDQPGIDKFAETRPLLVICADGSFSGSVNSQDPRATSYNAPIQRTQGPVEGSFMPTVVWFYSLKSQSYVDLLRFRSVVHLVRCSPRIVAVLQSAKIHCFNAATLEIECIIDSNPIPTGSNGSGSTGFGPLALGPRWIAYSGSQVSTSSSGRVTTQHLTPSASFPSNGSLFAHLAKESSKQLAAGIVTLGDKGYKKLSRYYSELLPDVSNSQGGAARLKVHGIPYGHSPDAESVGMVIVKDVVSQTVITQFKAHKSPILSLCFDPSGMLLVTASVQGHNINIFLIMPGGSSGSSSGPSYVHLYRLQRGLTNAVIQDISFSSDSQWILISSSRGTSHLFAISPTVGSVSSHSKPIIDHGPATGVQVLSEQMMSQSNSASPITLNAVSRIRNGSNVWINAVTGAAAAATGRSNSISGTIASVFHNCNGNNCYEDHIGLKKDYYLVVYSPSGSVIQYVLRTNPAVDGVEPYESDPDSDAKVVVEAIQKWNICQKQNQSKGEDIINMYSDSECRDSSSSISGKIYPDRIERESSTSRDEFGKMTKEKIYNMEKHNPPFISEAEIHSQEKENPLWAKPEIYLYSMQTSFNIDEEGEIEIENIPFHIIESGSRGFYQTSRFQQGRIPPINSENTWEHLARGSDTSMFGVRSSSNSLNNLATDGGMLVNESNESPQDKGHDGLQSLPETGNGIPDTNDTQSDTVIYTREDHTGDNQLRSVNYVHGLVEKFDD